MKAAFTLLLRQAEYSHSFWLSDKSIQLPALPGLPIFQDHPRFAHSRSPAIRRRPLFMGDASWH